MKSVALVFGGAGGIGQAVCDQLCQAQYQVHACTRHDLDWCQDSARERVVDLLRAKQPRVIVNCAGVFRSGLDHDMHETFAVNFGSNWHIIRGVNDLYRHKVMDFVMVGSSSYQGGRAAYPLYSASKAAVYNLWQSAQALFQETEIRVSLLNPQRTRTQMNADHYNPMLQYHEPHDVAREILTLVQAHASVCVDVQLEKS